MSKIILRNYQIDAIKKALQNKNTLWCMCTGSGKTISLIFLARLLLNRREVEKITIACTVSSIGPFVRELKKVGIEVKLIEDIKDYIEFLKSKEKFVLVKHSFIEELGKNKESIDILENFLKIDHNKIVLAIDEAHKFSNTESWGNFGVDNTRRFWEKIIILTATPYSSDLRQVFGLVKLIYPKQWKTLKTFVDRYIRTEIVKDWKTGKFLRTEDIEYVNLDELRKELSEFTFFYYPLTTLNYIEYKVELKPENYSIYKSMCTEVYSELKSRVGKRKVEEEE